MAPSPARFQVRFEADGDGNVKAAFDQINKSSEDTKRNADALQQSLTGVAQALDRQIALANKSSREAAISYEIQKGALQGLDEATKAHILNLAKQADAATDAAAESKKAAEDSKKAAEEAKQSWYDFGEGIGEALRIGTVALTGFALTGLALVIKNSIDAQNELAQLEAALLSSGQSANFTTQQLVALADSIAKASNFSGGDIISAETRLLSYSGIVTEKFAPALQVAIDQAARLGISVEQSAETVGRALESPTKAAAALAQQGFGAAFTKAVRNGIAALVDAGKEAEAQQVIIDILNDSYKGAAAAARDTLGGAFIQLKNTAADLLTGDSGGEGLKGVQQAVEDLINTLNDPDTKAGFATFAEGALTAVSALSELVSWSNKALEASTGWATTQLGGTRNVRDLAQIRNEQSDLQAEQQYRANGRTSDSMLVNAGLTRASWMSDAQLNARLAELKDLEERSLALFGDPAKPRVLINEGNPGDPQPSLRPANTRQAVPDAEDPAERKKRLAEEAREAKQLENAYERLKDSYGQQIAIGSQVADQSEVTKVRYATEQGALKDLTDAKKQELLVMAERLDQMDREVDLQKQLDQMDARRSGVLDDIAAERVELGLSNDQLEIRHNLLQAGVTAESAWGQSIVAATEQLQKQRDATRDAIDVQDAVRDGGKTLFTDAVTGAESFGDAAVNALNRVRDRLLDIIGENLMDQLFGQKGTTQTGSSGGWLSALGGVVGSLFGGNAASKTAATTGDYGAFNPNVAGFSGRATGGNVRAGSLHEVAEGGTPELLRSNGKTYLLSGADGTVVPAGYAAAGAAGSGSAAMPRINLTVHQNADNDDQQVSIGTDGSLDIELWFKGQMQKQVAAGALNKQLEGMYGISRQGSRRG